MIVKSSLVDHGGGDDQRWLQCLKRIHNNMYILYIARDTQCSIYTWSHAIASQEKSRSLESANDAKTGAQTIFGKTTQIMRFERHKEPYNVTLWIHKQGM